ncbi:MAG: hypothetical protein COV59_03220 [Candidatus Magasanikbacteria bacterium CG11_big_fil_rev_8_21_14_0_20_39_34]|uniref:DUF1905 domain-containing protein n=1 Tax=Candidatus Magasanikbacteria bacterium CG11_big_fil_rev_8_21_14_0_20_39_34 TaxID=1974653 RepID=A0A2H0N5I3_9BACT|nr:MAG: hypothetical protein COV59_03220 [Candidatus Magasanikbacteria bacterium CG11_big_fil_rev_8_21_14_0_20_39_34]
MFTFTVYQTLEFPAIIGILKGKCIQLFAMSTIRFTTKLLTIGSTTLVHLPLSASKKLPSRGMVMVDGNINGFDFQAPLEPDGKESHWFEVEKALLNGTGIKPGDTLTLTITPSKNWPDPKIPKDFQEVLFANTEAKKTWMDTTPLARWDWIRWIRSTKQPETRKRRIEVACSKLESGKKRPCCFNRNLCTQPSVSHNGILLENTESKK